jgi:serine/threonine protein kinase
MEDTGQSPRVVGRYVVHHELASGGMASVHIGRLMGPVGFSRTVAIKILHPQYAKDPEFVAMFVDEARLAARIRHPNVVSTLDVVAKGKDLLLVMDYVPGETLARLIRLSQAQGRQVPPGVVSAIVVDLLDGLHAAHEARDERDEPLSIVHRDVSPQNVMVGLDGTTRVLDFGIANATSRVQTTRDGALKGKFAYMAPEQVRRQKVDRRTDLFAASIVLWEALTGLRLFAAENPVAIATRIVEDPIVPPSTLVSGLSSAIDEVVLKGLSRDRNSRYATANEFARALENALPSARRSDVRAWVGQTANSILEERARRVADIENTPTPAAPSAMAEDLLTDLGGPNDIPIVHADLEETLAANAPLDVPPGRKRATWTWALGGLALASSLALVFVFRHPGVQSGAPGVPPVAEKAESMAAPSPGVASAAGSASTPTPSPSDDARASPLVSASSVKSSPAPSSEASAASPPPPVPPAPRVTTRVGTGGARPSNQCDPPYTINDAGAKRWKPACL